MTAASMLEIARAGRQDEEARIVLYDMILESGWWDDRIRYAFSTADDREEFLARLLWPGKHGGDHAGVIVQALESSRLGPPSFPSTSKGNE